MQIKVDQFSAINPNLMFPVDKVGLFFTHRNW